MKNHKAMVVISWIISVVAILAAVLISVGEGMSKMVIVNLGIAVGWLIIGIIHWKMSVKKER